jgi:2-polyprenyl-3-methyl-5-hydroxy-6-metoxy-1,4-benzoquinol methylase
MKLGICVPMYNIVPASFMVNFIHRLTELHTNGRNYEVKIYIEQSTVIDRARNILTKKALDEGCDYVMFIDADMLLPPNAIDDLIDMNLDIVSGLYFQKGKPYLPVARIKRNEDDEEHKFLEDFEFGEVLKVAGTGMGCCLIKREVFENIEYPYFRFEWKEINGKLQQFAEDLYFCDKAKKAGFDTYLNTGIVCEHFGTEVGASHFLMYKEQIKQDKLDREEVISCLAELDNITEDEVFERLRKRFELRETEWNKVDKNNPKEVEDYYINNNYEIYDHFHWHLNQRRNFDKKLVETIKRQYPDKSTEILDYGCSGGQVAYMLAKEGYIVTTYEPNKKCNEFISLRFNREIKNGKKGFKYKKLAYPLNPQIKNQYDLILCFDVLEHIPDERFEKVVNEIKQLKKPGGQIMATVSFGAQDVHPMHFDLTPEKKDLLIDLQSN